MLSQSTQVHILLLDTYHCRFGMPRCSYNDTFHYILSRNELHHMLCKVINQILFVLIIYASICFGSVEINTIDNFTSTHVVNNRQQKLLQGKVIQKINKIKTNVPSVSMNIVWTH